VKITVEEAVSLVNKHSDQGAFLAFEGINGSGKTTIMNHYTATLQDLGRTVTVTREPGATPLGAELRKILLEKSGSSLHLTYLAELLLFAADRTQHVHTLIKPSLENGEIVITDRYHYSTTAFQGFGRKMDLATISNLNDLATSGLEPLLVILLDIPPKDGLARIQRRNRQSNSTTGASGTTDVFEEEALIFHERVREGYLNLAHSSKTPFLIINALKAVDKINSLLSPIAIALSKKK
jgi:dTMP kinase